eukprot:scaffold3156_cov268-Chaetoceros_neogracile.AAC.2
MEDQPESHLEFLSKRGPFNEIALFLLFEIAPFLKNSLNQLCYLERIMPSLNVVELVHIIYESPPVKDPAFISGGGGGSLTLGRPVDD